MAPGSRDVACRSRAVIRGLRAAIPAGDSCPAAGDRHRGSRGPISWQPGTPPRLLGTDVEAAGDNVAASGEAAVAAGDRCRGSRGPTWRHAGRPPRQQGTAWRQQETPIAAPALAIERHAALNRQMLRWSGLLCFTLALGACAPSPASPEAPATSAAVPATAPAPGARDTGQNDDNRTAPANTAPADTPPADAAPAPTSASVHRIYDAVAGRPCAPVHELGGSCAICDRQGPFRAAPAPAPPAAQAPACPDGVLR